MNYCTWWFDGWWGQCCHLHDIAYSTGVVKSIADLALQNCVASVGAPIISWIMWIGVTLFGGFWYARAAKNRKKKERQKK